MILLLQEKETREDGHIPGLRRVPGAGHQVRGLSFMQERIH